MTRKRGNNEGTIRKRSDGRWEARIVEEDGTRRSFYGKTRQEVARLLAAGIRDRDAGLTAYTDRQTVEQFLQSWLERTQHTLKPSTAMRYAQDIRVHLAPTLGHVMLTKLTAQQVQGVYARKLSDGLAVSTVRNFHAVLRTALDDAVRLGLVQRSVATMTTPPSIRRGEMATLDEAQVRKLLAVVAGDRLEALLVMALATGMRRGELMTLKWADIDLDNASLQVRRTIQRTPRGWIAGEPKSRYSRRRIAIPQTLAAALRRHRIRQSEERLKLGEAWLDEDLVFTTPIGSRLPRSVFEHSWFHPLLQKAALPRMRFHDLRHTAATLLLARGINPKVVSEMLGHSSIAITLSLYGHVTPHMQQQAADTMDRVLGG
jgi:integrase